MIVVRDEIEEIVMSVQSSGSVTSFVDNLDGTYAIGLDAIGNLQAGFKILLKYADASLNRDAVIDSISGSEITITDTKLTQPDTWEMALYFEVGHRAELIKKYINKAKSTNKKVQEYPLFWLYTDCQETPGEQGTYTEMVTTLQSAIVNRTEKELYEENRIEQKFKPVLYPLYELITGAFNSSTYKQKFVTSFGNTEIKFQKIDRPFFGSIAEDKNVLPQITDAIELEYELKWFKQETNCQISI